MDEEDFYDVHDPFIDDSDLQELVGSVIIEPKVTGYFMWRGSVETVHVQVGSVLREAKGFFRLQAHKRISCSGRRTAPRKGDRRKSARHLPARPFRVQLAKKRKLARAQSRRQM